MLKYYVLRDKTPVPCVNLPQWVHDMNRTRHVVASTINGALISTVFLGIDHNWLKGGTPQLFETMIFEDGPLDGRQWRYATYEEAEDMHGKIVAALQAGTPLP